MVAADDLLFALQTPMEGLSIFNYVWELGDVPCKFHRFLLHTFYNVVILSLTVVSIERYSACDLRVTKINLSAGGLSLRSVDGLFDSFSAATVSQFG